MEQAKLTEETNDHNLNPSHLAHLIQDSAISPSIIKRAELRSLNEQQAFEVMAQNFCGGLAFPYWNCQGKELGSRIRLDRPQAEKKYHQRAGSSLTCYFLKDTLAQVVNPHIPLIITEGEKKLLSIASHIDLSTHAIASFPGCWNWVLAKEKRKIFDERELSDDWKMIPFTGRKVYLVPDTGYFTNEKENKAYNEFISQIVKAGAHVYLIDLRVDGHEEKMGADDFIVKEGATNFKHRLSTHCWEFYEPDTAKVSNPSNQDIKNWLKAIILKSEIEKERFNKTLKTALKCSIQTIRDVAREVTKEFKEFQPDPRHNSQSANRPLIQWDSYKDGHAKLYEQIGKCISDIEGFYMMADSSKLAYIDSTQSSFSVLESSDSLSTMLSHDIDFREGKWSDEGFKGSSNRLIPAKYLAAIMQQPNRYLKLNELRFFSKLPVVINDNLVSQPGYDTKTKVYYSGSQVQGIRSTALLRQLLGTWPFQDEVSLHNALGAIIGAAFFLEQYPGKHPLILIQGDSQDLGKSTLVECMIKLCFNDDGTKNISYSSNDTEFENRIATEIASSNFVSIDNIQYSGIIQSASLERTLTSPVANFRRLGHNMAIQRRNNVQFFVTVNNGRFGDDLICRSLPIFLSKNIHDAHTLPEDFNPVTFIQDNLLQLQAELVGMVENWIEQGRPRESVPFRKFPEYAKTIAGILKVNGFDYFMANANDAYFALNSITTAIKDIGKEYIGGKQFTPTDFVDLILEREGEEPFAESTTPQGRLSKVGKALKNMAGKPFYIEHELTQKRRKIQLCAHQQANKKGSNFKYDFDLAPVFRPLTFGRFHLQLLSSRELEGGSLSCCADV